MDLGTLYRDIVETSLDGIWVLDVEGRTVYANPTLAVMLGREVDELATMTAFDVLDDTGKAQLAGHLQEVRRGVVVEAEVECLFYRKDGSALWVLVRESPRYDDQGNVVGYLHRVTDFTDRRELFEELRTSRERLAEAQRIARVGDYEWDLVHDVVRASDELHSLYQVPREDFGGHFDDFMALVHPEDRTTVLDAVATALDGAGTYDVVFRVERPGGLAWIRGRGEIVRDAQGSPVLARGTHQDVTDAKQTELMLRDLVAQNTLMEKLAAAANEAEHLVDVLQVAQELLLHHDDWDRARGFLPREGEPDGIRPLYLDDTARREDEARPELVALERRLAVQALDSRGQVWDERTFPEHPVIAFPVLGGDEVAALIVISASTPFERQPMIRQMIDRVASQLGRVAERERAARELAQARDAAMAASQQKSEFLATMSHEIRTPLNGVIGLNELLLRTELDPHQQRLASGAHVASRALLGIINDILDFSKIEAGRLELEHVDFDVRRVLDDVGSVLGESARSKGIELLVSCDHDVPDRLNGDPTRLAQVLTNLGSNAVKFTHEGEVLIHAALAEGEEDGRTWLRVEVVDTGVGVSEEQRRHIFDPFRQADASTTRRYGGTGLGLAIAGEIVAAYGGEIGVESTPGEGSTFWFTAGFRPTASGGDERPRERALAGRRVLVVDDNEHNRAILRENLGRLDVRTGTAADAVRAMHMLRSAVAEEDPYDAVLADMVMPDYDGTDLAAMIRQDPTVAETPLVLLTSSTPPDPEVLSRLGIVEVLSKPAPTIEVVTSLRRAVGEDEGTGRRTVSRPRAGHPAHRPRLLVVEDNPVNQLVALGILETLGYTADTADDGLEALERLERFDYAGVLMDVQMPRMDGYAATRALRERERPGARVPVIAMTAAAVEGEREKCLAAGMDDFLTKPVNPDLLSVLLRRWVERDGGPVPDVAEPAGTPRAEGELVMDRDRLDMLRELDPGNTAYLDKAIENFVARAGESLDTIRRAVERADAAALTAAAHRLKGSALNLGLPRVGQVAYELERLGDEGSTKQAHPALAALEGALQDGVSALAGYRDEHAPGRAG